MNKKVCNLLDNILRIIIVILILVKIINLEFEDIGMLVLTFILTFYNWFLKKVFKINLNIRLLTKRYVQKKEYISFFEYF